MGESPLFGPTQFVVTTARGEFVCPVERKRTTYEVRRVQRRFAALGLALPIGRGETIRCASCGVIVDPGSLAKQLSEPVQPAAAPLPGMAPPSSAEATLISATTPPPSSLAVEPAAVPPGVASPPSEVASPRTGIASPPPGMAPRVIAPDALATGPLRVAPPPSAGSPAAPPPSDPMSAPTAPPTIQSATAQPSPAADRPRLVAPPPWTVHPEARPAQSPPASRINDKTRITTRSPRREVRWRLLSVDGALIDIDGTIVVGRDPSSNLVANSTAVPIADEGRSMSKSHAVLRVNDEGLFVEDLHSTNGVRIVRGGSEIKVAAGTPAAVRAGDVLVLGEREFGIEANY